MEQIDFKRRVKFVLRFGRALQAVGSPAHSLEGTLQELSQLVGIKGTFLSLPTSLHCHFTNGEEEMTRIERTEPMGVNLGKLSQVDLVSQDVLNNRITFEEGITRLDEISESPDPYGKRIRVTHFVLSVSGFMVLFGGSWGDLLSALFVGLILGLMNLMRPQGVVAQVFEAAVAVVASLATYLLAKLIPGLNVGVIILSSLIIFMPGLYITIAIAEIATQNLVSGTARLMGGVMILLKLTFGVFIGNKIASWFHYPSLDITLEQIPTWVTFLTLPITALMSTVIFKANRSDWPWVTSAGIFGFSCAKLGTFYLGPELGMFFGGACVGAMSNVFARSFNRPSSIFQFPGIILLVPGSVGYKSLSFLYERNVLGGLDTAFTMVTLAMALVVGIFFGNIIVKPRSSI